MANRDKIQQRGAVEDRRGLQPAKVIGGVGVAGIILVLAVGYFSGPETAFQLLDDMSKNTRVVSEQVDESVYAGDDAYEVFVSKVIGSTNDLWNKAFANSGLRYQEPRLVLFRGATQSACGGAISQVGPHYCPADKTIYLDETFFETLQKRFGARGGDLAQAYVLSHEVGHHVQNLLGLTKRVRSNEDSIRLELQADCLAGIRVGTIDDILDENDIYEAIDAAEAVGDDTIQKKTAGYVQPESRTHGSSKQRKQRFSIGYKYGDFQQCDTFSG